jgi:hypothetical protein
MLAEGMQGALENSVAQSKLVKVPTQNSEIARGKRTITLALLVFARLYLLPLLAYHYSSNMGKRSILEVQLPKLPLRSTYFGSLSVQEKGKSFKTGKAPRSNCRRPPTQISPSD